MHLQDVLTAIYGHIDMKGTNQIVELTPFTTGEIEKAHTYQGMNYLNYDPFAIAIHQTRMISPVL